MNIYLAVILFILIGKYLLDVIIEILNIKNISFTLPREFIGFYDAAKYKKAQDYLKESTNFKLLKNTVFTLIVLVFILTGGFNFIDKFTRGFNRGPIFTGLIFAGFLLLAFQILNIPFSAYHTFVIEEKYGFNSTTVKTFVLDILKTCLLGALIGAVAFGGILWFFDTKGKFAWVYCWVGLVLFQIFLIFIAPVLILPLFNKFIPLEDGELKDAIEHYSASQNFKIKGILKIDASRRSTKSNAFFTGLGKYKRIALFDNLIKKLTPFELVSVLAHEIGHYKKRHILKNLIYSIATLGIMFFILSFFINNKGLFEAFKMENLSIYASLVFFGFLYTPINMVFSILGNFLSRKHEYQADAYVISTYKKPEDFILALKKLSVDNLSNLTPHPLKVFFHYSHPPILQRIERIKEISKSFRF